MDEFREDTEKAFEKIAENHRVQVMQFISLLGIFAALLGTLVSVLVK